MSFEKILCSVNESNFVKIIAFEILTVLSVQTQKCTINVDKNCVMFDGVSVIVH